MIHQFAIRPSGGGTGGATASLLISAGASSDLRTDVTFANSNGVSFGLDAAGVITATVQTNYLTTAMASNRGSDFVQATAAFAGTNASGTINSTGISVSVAAAAAASVNFSAGTTSSNLSAVTFSNSNGVSFGLGAAGVITATVATNYAGTGYTTATTAGSNLVGTLNSAGLSQGVPAFLTALIVSAGSTSQNVTAIRFQSANNVSFQIGTGANSSDIQAGAFIAVYDSVSSFLKSYISFQNSNGVSWGVDTNGTVTASVATNYAGTGYTTATTAGTNIVGTLNSAGLSQRVPAWLTTAALSQDSSKYAGTAFATTTSAGAVIAGTLNTSGLTLGVPAFLTTAALSSQTLAFSLGGNSATTNSSQILNGGYILAGGANVTIQQSNNTISISAASAAAAPINISAGTTSTNATAFTFSNANNVSFGLGTGASSQNITASIATTYAGTGFTTTTTAGTAIVGTLNTSGLSMGVPAFLTTAMASNAATISNINVSAGTTSNNLSAVTFSNSNGVSFGLNGSTITASYQGFQSYWANSGFMASSTVSLIVSTSYVCPFWLPYYVSASYIRLPASFGFAQTTFGTTANTQFTAQLFSTINAVVYSLGTGASSNSLQSVVSGSAPFAQKLSWSAGNTGSQWSVSASVTYPTRGTTSQFATNDVTTLTNLSIQSSQLTAFTGLRYLDIPFANSLSPGAYWLMVGASSTSSTQGNAAATNQIISMSHQMISQINAAIGDLAIAVPASQAWQLGIGLFSTNAVGTTASLDLTNITRTAGVPSFAIQFIRQA